MDKSIILVLLNPAISLAFSISFFVLWRHQRDRPYVLLLAFAYLSAVFAFLLQYFTLPVGFDATKFLSNLLFMVMALLMAGAVLARYERLGSWPELAAISVAGMGVFTWFLIGDPSLTGRIYAVNFAFGALALVVAAALRRVENKTTVDKLLMALFLFSGLNFLLRTPLIVRLDGGYTTYDNFYLSLYFLTTAVSHALLSLMIALCLTATIVFDIIGKLRTETMSDPLSGALNRRGFEERAGAVLRHADSTGLPVALVIADLDHFKVVNDSFGHAAGDQAIAAFASHLLRASGSDGIVGRMGGEEFAVILPGSGLAAARLFAEGVRVSFAGMPIDGLPAGRAITASFGVAARLGNEDLAALVRRADKGLYHAKSAGRNCVRVAGQDDAAGPAMRADEAKSGGRAQ